MHRTIPLVLGAIAAFVAFAQPAANAQNLELIVDAQAETYWFEGVTGGTIAEPRGFGGTGIARGHRASPRRTAW